MLLVENKAQAVRDSVAASGLRPRCLAVLGDRRIVFGTSVPIDSRTCPRRSSPPAESTRCSASWPRPAAALYIFVAAISSISASRFARKPTDPRDAIGVQVHDNHKLEFWWTIFPRLFVVLLSIVSVRIWYRDHAAQPDERPRGRIDRPSVLLHVPLSADQRRSHRRDAPAGQRAGTLNVTSSDVIHSFWVPALRLKNDMVPGLVNTIRFTPTVGGRYPIICTQFCGTVTAHERGRSHQAGRSSIESKGRLPEVVSQAGSQECAREQRTAAGGRPARSPSRAATRKPARRSSHRSAPPATRSARSRRRIVGPGLKGVLHDPSHPNLVDGDPATPDDVAKILQNGLHRRHGQRCPTPAANGISDQDIANLVAFLASLK